MGTRKLVVEVIGDSKSLERSFSRSSSAARKFGTETSSSVGKAEAAFSRLQKIAAGSLIGGVALAGLREVIAAAKESQVVLGQTSVAVDDAGIAWEQYAARVQASADAISKASAFDDEEVLKSFAVFVRAQKNVQQSLNLSALAADVARGRFTDLESATQLVNKAALGQVGALRRAGIQIDANATATEALTALQKAYGGAAVKYADSAAGATDRLRVSLDNLAEATGGPLLHGIELINDGLSIAIDRMDKLGESSDVAAARLKNANFDASLAALNGPGVNLKKLQELFAEATNIVAPGEGFVRPAGTAATDKAAKAVADKLTAGLNKAFGIAQKAVADAIKQQKAAVDKAAGEAAQAAREAAADKLSDAFQKLIGNLQLGVDRAGLTRRLNDDLETLKALKAGLERQVKAGVDVAAAQSQLVSVIGQIADTRKEIQEQARDAVQARQFRALGLSASGDEIVPSVANLSKRLDALLAGNRNIPSKLLAHLKEARKEIRKEGDKLTTDTRDVINDFIKAATGQDQKQTGPLTRTRGLNLSKILGGLDLTRDLEKQLRARLSSFNSAGRAVAGAQITPSGFFRGGVPAVPIMIENTITLDGEIVSRNTTRHQQKNARRNPRQKTGPNAGRF
jgi:hypothetical protein